MKMSGRVTVSPGRLAFNGDVCAFGGLNELYRRRVGGYPKFFKMDGLCKLGFLAAEFLLKDIPAEVKENAAIILFNRSGSLAADRNYQRTIGDASYFPSPALFVYTLANIVTGEIAIRHKILGESSFYILDNRDDEEMEAIVCGTFHTSNPPMVIAGWVEYENDSEYLADMWIVENQQQNRYSKMDELILQIKNQVIEALNLDDMTADDIDEQAPLFGEGLGLDSIDALELIVLMEREYGIRLSNPAEGKAIFSSVAAIADYVSKNRKK